MKPVSALISTFLLPALISAASLLQMASSSAKAMKNPLQNEPGASFAGQKLFQRECSGCHGLNGQGNGRGRTPALANSLVRTANPGTLFWIMKNGSASHRMPSFSQLPDDERWQIIAFLQR